MDIKINQKIIKDMCGTVSFKRGEAYHRANKVKIEDDGADCCTATVKGVEDFVVTIGKDVSGRIQASCSCPTVADFTKSCQHVAAVLLAILEQKRQRNHPVDALGEQAGGRQLAEGILTLFQDEPPRKSRHQLHFENRQVLDVQFILKPCAAGKGQYLLGMELSIGGMKISHIRHFLHHVKLGRPCTLSASFTFDPDEHCFTDEVHEVLQQLIRITHDEMAFLEALPENRDQALLFIPPSAWGGLPPLLGQLPALFVEQDGQPPQPLRFADGTPPFHFIVEAVGNDYRLTMEGFERLLLFGAYHVVMDGGRVFQLDGQDCERLVELQQMLVTPNADYVSIPHDQIDLFLQKVVPGLRKMGEVSLPEQLTRKMMKTPLVTKLYLDRLKNRLLAGLEFHYGHVVIQPLEGSEQQPRTVIVRDVQKEQEVLDIMERSGFTATEGGYFMQNEELEYDFLHHVLPKLQALAQIYATTAVRNRLVKKSAFPKMAVKVKKERTNWLEFKFEMDGITDGQVKEILQALEMKRKYYRLPNDSLLSLETKEMEEIRRFLLAGPVQDDEYEATFNMPIVESLKFLELMEESEAFAPEESFRQFLDGLLQPEKLAFDVPPSLAGVLRDYQKQGFRWMKALASYGFGGVLADEMGLGKTVQSIAFIVSELANIRMRNQPVLIVCPSSLTYNWLHELLTFAPEIQALVIDGDTAARKELQRNLGELDVLITSYPLLRRDLAWYEKQTFHTVFFDEAQAFKNPMTQTARAVKKIKADHRFGLTGTPLENSQEELWSIYHVIFPQLFRGLEDYSHLTRKAIARRVRPFLLRRLKEDVLTELPGKNEALELSELLPEQKELYAALLAKLRHDALKHLDQESFRKNRIRILAGLTRLRQICCHPGLFVDGYKGSSAKFEQLLQILEESRLSGRRVLVFSQFTKMLGLIGRELAMQDREYFYLDGQTPSEERVELCNRFNEGERDVFLISLKAGGTGLNLTGADTVILYDLWWNPAVEAQAAGRAHRMGQKNTVQVIKLIARGTIEEKMNELQEKKRDLIADILTVDEKAPAALTEADIREILMI
ncbi:MAG: SNF2 helicase associated domain-containing protein [Lysinibacillus sp.]